ncbi:response regulator [Metapseudomonas otitidis]|uniref:Response regulator n=1 Tax=Metapseudomonas otitidis TaxID=319939 RepID=A0A7X3KUL7_9GAMM|nr:MULTISPECIES: response regulator transcription factor [Pseudomonas]KIV72347.1 DNA-binding response regulator, LuxR family, near polyamine transporter [Pseudomonas sp. FeS53a]MDH1109206.1 response regulator transcription factor [Pseudomonas otitidis]MDH1160980.1 response regulator transcription factor [Pseudomonas otitidis]MDH1163088.1 response regulator transcription factor [Pseudomonas otitidis]MDI6528583.1 response regulator transcription factor [Pseudomonas otitidis]
MTRILIADDHAIMRGGLKQLIEFDARLQVAAEAENGAQVLEQLRTGEFDLLLLDMSMPGLSGEDLISRVHGRYPRLPILVLSMHNEAQIAQRALRAGASGYLTKDHNPETLLAAIHRVAGGGRYLDPRIAEQLAFASSSPTDDAAAQLSDREFQILRLLAQGLSVNQIADQLVISNKTVSTHKTRLMEKMGFTCNADIIKYAMTHGLTA